MRIVVCAKEVLDPDAVNNYALAGNLTIGADGKTPEVSAIPRLINGYDEQALEAALRLKDAGVECTISAVSIGNDQKDLLKKCVAMGADEIVAIDADASTLDGMATATLLAAYVEQTGGADLILCGRQASDDDQGVVPALLAEKLGMPIVPIARAVEINGDKVTVTRATPDGDEVVEGATPAVVTVTNELGEPRFPTAKQKMQARKKKPALMSVAELGLSEADLAPQVELVKQYVPEVLGNCEFLEGSPEEIAKQLIDKLRADSII
jgi:electron transfer flavoprotein beta subunit